MGPTASKPGPMLLNEQMTAAKSSSTEYPSTEMIKKMIAARNAQAQNQANTSGKSQPVVNSSKKVGRNDPCPCGSGKKYTKCCGANEQ